MAECERLNKCPFFTDRMTSMPNVSEVMKRTYCLGEQNGVRQISVGFGRRSNTI